MSHVKSSLQFNAVVVLPIHELRASVVHVVAQCVLAEEGPQLRREEFEVDGGFIDVGNAAEPAQGHGVPFGLHKVEDSAPPYVADNQVDATAIVQFSVVFHCPIEHREGLRHIGFDHAVCPLPFHLPQKWQEVKGILMDGRDHATMGDMYAPPRGGGGWRIGRSARPFAQILIDDGNRQLQMVGPERRDEDHVNDAAHSPENVDVHGRGGEAGHVLVSRVHRPLAAVPMAEIAPGAQRLEGAPVLAVQSLFSVPQPDLYAYGNSNSCRHGGQDLGKGHLRTLEASRKKRSRAGH